MSSQNCGVFLCFLKLIMKVVFLSYWQTKNVLIQFTKSSIETECCTIVAKITVLMAAMIEITSICEFEDTITLKINAYITLNRSLLMCSL